jgi:hypothetical protein
MKAVRDNVASFFFHPFVDLDILKRIVRSMKDDGFRFTTIGGLPIRTRTSFGIVTNVSGPVSVRTQRINGRQVRLAFPGMHLKAEPIPALPLEGFERKIELKPGELYAVHFIPSIAKPADGKSGKATVADTRMKSLQQVTNFYGEKCRVVRPMVISPSPKPFRLDAASQALSAPFELIGIGVSREHVAAFSHIPPGVNLVLLAGSIAERLSENQIQLLMRELERGNIYLVTSGFTLIASRLGIEKTDRNLRVAFLRDNYFSNVAMRWRPSQTVSHFEAPGNASYIYEDVATGSPLVISSQIGKGRFIFLNLPPESDVAGNKDPYPYLMTHIFRSFRLFPLIRNKKAEIYFNPAEREDISIETLIKDWRRSGVSSIYVTGWQVFPEWTYDYAHLIRLAHTNGMLVYAWFELPFVNEKFWLEHPRWRERNALGQDAVIDWRKPMGLGDPECFRAVQKELAELLLAYDWDGAIFNRMGWESPAEKLNPAVYTPFDAASRAQFREKFGFDPQELFDPNSAHYFHTRSSSLKLFEEYRQEMARRWSWDLLEGIDRLRSEHQKDWEIILTYDDRDLHSGLSIDDYLALKNSFGLRLQLATDTRRQWQSIPEHFDMVRLFFSGISELDGFRPHAVTAYPTGMTLYRVLNDLIKKRKRFSLFSENALFEVDKQMFPFLFATESRSEWSADRLLVMMPASAQLVFASDSNGQMAIDGELAGSFYNSSLLMPLGIHTVAPRAVRRNLLGALKSKARLVDCSADLIGTAVTSLGLEITYWSDRRTTLVVNEKPLDIALDGERVPNKSVQGLPGWSVMVPAGNHTVSVRTRTITELLLVFASLVVSNTIQVISLVAVSSLIGIASITVFRSRNDRDKKRRS